MASYEIKDLPDSIELDRDAMSAIYGGSKTPMTAGLENPKKRGRNATSLFFASKSAKHIRR